MKNALIIFFIINKTFISLFVFFQCTGVLFVDTSVWLSCDPENSGTLHTRTNCWGFGWTSWKHRKACTGPVWKLCYPTCVGTWTTGRSSQNSGMHSWQGSSSKSAQVCKVMRAEIPPFCMCMLSIIFPLFFLCIDLLLLIVGKLICSKY